MRRLKKDSLYIKIVREGGDSLVAELEKRYAKQAVENLPPGTYVISRHGKVFRIFNLDELSSDAENEANNESEKIN